ncbi:MAG: hypothetical protein ACKV2Q_34805 [Planctomycetaceae bacterium]
MLNVPVEMRFSLSRQRETLAWFVPGETPREWLSEVTQWNVPLASLRLWIVPRSSADRQPCGVLVTETCNPKRQRGSETCNPKRQRGSETSENHDPNSLADASGYMFPHDPNSLANASGYMFRPAGQNEEDRQADNPSHAGASIPYGCIEGRLFVPIEATFLPQLDPSNWRELLPSGDEDLSRDREGAVLGPDRSLLSDGRGSKNSHVVCVWHPTAGFITFEQSQSLRVADLLQAPVRRAADWNQARSGLEFPSRLTAVWPRSLPTMASLLEEGRGDIGSRGDDWSELPRTRDEPADNPLAKLGGKMLLGLAAAGGAVVSGISKALRALSGGGGATSSSANETARSGGAPPARSGWSLALEQMAQRLFERMRKSLEPTRQKALQRLMDMLENDPDEGLKFALPFGGDEQRGIAPPSDQLPERPVNFDLNRMGSGPGDQWDMSAEMQAQLTARYRELANREMQLGRYRRAAYIFGHLLREYAAAANTLVAGKHWREAAVLYRDKLGQPHEAARCLEQGGLLNEAIVIYEELKQFEKAGDLYLQLEQTAEARRAWGFATQQLMLSNDFLAAAKITDSKLQEPDRALAQLDRGWTRAIQTEACLAESFRLLARLGRHSETSRRIAHWRDHESSAGALVSSTLLVQQLSNLVQSYPDSGVRHLAGDSARILTVRDWDDHKTADRQRMLQAITALAPEDRLLARDTQRFATLAKPPDNPKSSLPKPTPNSKQLLRLIEKWTLPNHPNHILWQAATSNEQHWFAVGLLGGAQVVTRGDWSHKLPPATIPLPNTGEALDESLLFSAASQADGPVVVMNSGGKARVITNWSAKEHRDADQPLPNWLADDTVGLCRQPGIVWVLRETPSCFVIECHSEPSGLLLHTQQMNFAAHEPRNAGLHPLFVDSSGRKFVADGSTLLMPHYDGGWASDRGPIQSLTGMTFERVTRLALTFVSGAEILWDDGHEVRSSRLSDDYSHPVATFTRRGHLVVADATTCDVFNVDRSELRFRARGPEKTARPIALLPAPHLDQFALITADGQVRLFQIPRP